MFKCGCGKKIGQVEPITIIYSALYFNYCEFCKTLYTILISHYLISAM